MYRRFLIAAGFALCLSCKNDPDAKAENGQNDAEMAFDAAKWKTVDKDSAFVYREKMLHDLVYSQNLKALNEQQLLERLGPPTRKDNGYLFYQVSQEKAGFFPLHTKTLVVKLSAEGQVEKVLIHK